ncbi:hypothetical protein MTR_3g113590 [Medicago truncatula]|nr:hypothetical protein MTR_3g113590 [Medicago truncatula]
MSNFNENKHIAVFPFPFSSHPLPVLNLTIKTPPPQPQPPTTTASPTNGLLSNTNGVSFFVLFTYHHIHRTTTASPPQHPKV